MDKRLIEKQKNVMRSVALLGTNVDLARNAEGEAIVVVALPSERLSDVLQRMSGIKAPFNLVIAYAESFEVLVIQDHAKKHGTITVSPAISMGMLALRVSRNPHKLVKIDIEDQEDLSREITILPQFAYA